jgi:nucleoside-diphosphate-sugar epimerase
LKILVTGANGFLGSSLVRCLLMSGETDIRCFVRSDRRASKLRAFSSEFLEADIQIYIGDLTSREDAREALEGVDIVYHLAAAMTGTAADLFLNTVVASKNLLEGLTRRNSTRVVLVSSLAVYGTAHLPRGSIVNEDTPVERHPERRDIYSHAKLRQEQLFWQYHEKYRFPLVVLRPGVVYGPEGPALSSRIGVNLLGLFLHFGANNPLPLTYVDNCADAIVTAGRHADSAGKVYNVVDDDLLTARQYLRAYRRGVKRIRYISLPYFVVQGLSKLVERYHVYSKGQLPAVFSPYKSACLWKPHSFDNNRLKSIGWRQRVATPEGIARTFSHLQRQFAMEQ